VKHKNSNWIDAEVGRGTNSVSSWSLDNDGALGRFVMEHTILLSFLWHFYGSKVKTSDTQAAATYLWEKHLNKI